MTQPIAHHLTEEEKAFLKNAQRLAHEVSAMTDEQVADYIIDNDLQSLVAPERVNAIFEAAIAEAGEGGRFTRPRETDAPGDDQVGRIEDRPLDAPKLFKVLAAGGAEAGDHQT